MPRAKLKSILCGEKDILTWIRRESSQVEKRKEDATHQDSVQLSFRRPKSRDTIVRRSSNESPRRVEVDRAERDTPRKKSARTSSSTRSETERAVARKKNSIPNSRDILPIRHRQMLADRRTLLHRPTFRIRRARGTRRLELPKSNRRVASSVSFQREAAISSLPLEAQ